MELGIADEANEALEQLPNKVKAHPAVLLGRLELLMHMKRWDTALVLGQSLCGLWPEESQFWSQTAYCLHEMKLTEEAKLALFSAPESLRETSVYDYNLAC